MEARKQAEQLLANQKVIWTRLLLLLRLQKLRLSFETIRKIKNRAM